MGTPQKRQKSPRLWLGEWGPLIEFDFPSYWWSSSGGKVNVAIVTYLGDTYGRETELVPEPYSHERAVYNEWCAFIQMELDAHTLYVLRKHRDLADLYGEAPAAVTTAIAGFQKQVAVADAALQSSDHLVGNQFTAADIIMTTTLKWAIAYNIDLTPRLREYTALHAARPAYRSAGRLTFSISPGA